MVWFLKSAATKRYEKMARQVIPDYDDQLKAAKDDKEKKAALNRKVEEALAQQFLFSGLDLKGATSTGLTKSGAGLGLSGSFNPTAAFGFNTEISAKAGGSAAKQVFVIATVTPKVLSLGGKDVRIHEPLTAHSFDGVWWTANLGAGIDVNLGVSAYVGKSAVSGKIAVDKPATMSFELLGASAAAKAGAEASAGYAYTHFYGADRHPLRYADASTADLRRDLGVLLAKGRKEMLKSLKDKALADQAIKDADKPNEGDGQSFLYLSSHAADGLTGVYGKVGASAGAGGGAVAAKAELKVSAPNAVGHYKKSYARFQTSALADDKSVVHTTYDTAITYSSFDLSLLKAQPTAGVFVGGNDITKPIQEAIDKATGGATWKFKKLNHMRYRTAVAVWQRPAGPAKDGSVDALRGTGVARGESVTIASLRAIYDGFSKIEHNQLNWDYDGAEGSPYVQMLLEQLHLTLPVLLEFLSDVEVHDLITDFPDEGGAGVFIEATFAAPPTTKLPCKVDANGVHLGSNFAAKLFEVVSSPEMVQSIRLRYRLCDVHDDGKTFTVGFKILGQGVGITLRNVDEAGQDALIDLRTVFVDPKFGIDVYPTPDAAYEAAVPAAVLFCQ